MISVSFIGKQASYVVLRVEQQLRTMSVCYLENDASLPVVMRVKQQLKCGLCLCYLKSCSSRCYASCNTGAHLSCRDYTQPVFTRVEQQRHLLREFNNWMEHGVC